MADRVVPSSPFRRVIACCPIQMKDYGQCVASKALKAEKGMCEKEFMALKACMRNVVWLLRLFSGRRNCIDKVDMAPVYKDLGAYEIGLHGSGATSHAYIQYPPFRCDIAGALGVTYDDGNKLLIVPTLGKVYSWPVTSYPPPKDPVITDIKEGPVLGVRFSLDCKILAIVRSNTEVEFINREDCTSFRQPCKSGTERILGLFWTDCPDCDVVFVTTSGLELYALYLGRNRLKLVEKKRQDVSWFVYTHESRLVILASGMQCKTLSGYQFSTGGIVRLPKFDAVMSKSESNRKPVLASENVHIATMYGRLYCLQVDPIAKLLHMYRFYRDAVISQGSLPTYASNVSVSVVDNVLLIHQVDSKVVLLYDILSDSKVPISAPLPLLLRRPPSGSFSQAKNSTDVHLRDVERKSEAEKEASLYGEGWVFGNPDIILDHTHGLLWKISLDLEAIAASSSDVPSLLAFLQRRRHEAAKAKQLSIFVLRSVIMERRSLPLISAALAVITSASGHANRSRPTGTFRPAVPLSSTPGIQPAALASGFALSNEIEVSKTVSNGGSGTNGSLKGNDIGNTAEEIDMNDGKDISLGESSSARSLEFESQVSTPSISPFEMYEDVFAAIEEGMTVDSGFLVAVIFEYMRSATVEQLRIPPELHVLVVQLLAKDKCYVKLQQLIADKVLEPSKPLALQLLEVGVQCFETRKLGMDVLRQVHAHKEYLTILLHEGRLLEGLRYIRQNKIETVSPVLFLEAASRQQNLRVLASVLRYCCDFVHNFEQTQDYEMYYSLVKQSSGVPGETGN